MKTYTIPKQLELKAYNMQTHGEILSSIKSSVDKINSK